MSCMPPGLGSEAGVASVSRPAGLMAKALPVFPATILQLAMLSADAGVATTPPRSVPTAIVELALVKSVSTIGAAAS